MLEEAQSLYEPHGLRNASMESASVYGAVENETGRVVDAWRKRARDDYIEILFQLQFDTSTERIEHAILMLPDEGITADERVATIMAQVSRLPKQCKILEVPEAAHPDGWQLDRDDGQGRTGFLLSMDLASVGKRGFARRSASDASAP